MVQVLLALSIFTTVVNAGESVVVVVHTAKTVHHHFVSPIYKHVLKPVGKASKVVAKGVTN